MLAALDARLALGALAALATLAARGALAGAGDDAGALLAGAPAATFDRDRRLLLLAVLWVLAPLFALFALLPSLLLSMPPWPRHAPRPPCADVVPSLHGTLAEVLVLAEVG